MNMDEALIKIQNDPGAAGGFFDSILKTVYEACMASEGEFLEIIPKIANE